MNKPIDQLKQDLKFASRKFIPSDLVDNQRVVEDLTRMATDEISDGMIHQEEEAIARTLLIPKEEVPKYRHLVMLEIGEPEIKQEGGTEEYPDSVVVYQNMKVRFKTPEELLGHYAAGYLDYWKDNPKYKRRG